MKKAHAIILLALLTAALASLAACASGGGKVTDTDAPTVPDTDPAPTEAPAGEPTEAPTEAATEPETVSLEEQAASLREILNTAEGGLTLSTFGGASVDEASLAPLQAEIDALEVKGKMVSFILIDVETGRGLAYNCDKPWTSQSTVKAPYLTSVLLDNPSVLSKEKKLYKAVITVSDNDAYETLRNKYGDVPFRAFCKASSVSLRHTQDLYPRSITVRDMAKLWTNMYVYLNTTDEAEYVSWFTGTAFSCIWQGLGDRYVVQTKAGWESGTDEDSPYGTPAPRFVDGDPSNDETATNDTGVIYADGHPYILALFTNLQSDPPSLIPLVQAIDDVHTALVK